MSRGPLSRLLYARRVAVHAAVRRHNGRAVSVFGSVARGDERDGSDVDLLVGFEPGSSLFDLLHLQDDLSELLGVAVDVVSTGGLRARDEHIRREAIPVWVASCPAPTSYGSAQRISHGAHGGVRRGRPWHTSRRQLACQTPSA